MDNLTEVEREGLGYFQRAADYGMTRAEDASHLIVIECTIPGKSDLYSQRDIALERLGLIRFKDQPNVRIVFAHAMNTGDLHAWRGLFRDAIGVSDRYYEHVPLGGDPYGNDFNVETGIDLAVERIQRLEHSGNLVTYLVPEYLVGAPTVFMNIMSDNPLGFILFASGDDESRLRCLIYPEEYAMRWIEVIGKPLVAGTLPGMVSCPFASVKDRLVQEVRNR